MIKTKYINYCRLDKCEDFEKTGNIMHTAVVTKIKYDTKKYALERKEYMANFTKGVIITFSVFFVVLCCCIPAFFLNNLTYSIVAKLLLGTGAIASFMCIIIFWVDNRDNYDSYLEYILSQDSCGKMLIENNQRIEEEQRQTKEKLRKEEKEQKLKWAENILKNSSPENLVEILDYYTKR